MSLDYAFVEVGPYGMLTQSIYREVGPYGMLTQSIYRATLNFRWNQRFKPKLNLNTKFWFITRFKVLHLLLDRLANSIHYNEIADDTFC